MLTKSNYDKGIFGDIYSSKNIHNSWYGIKKRFVSKSVNQFHSICMTHMFKGHFSYKKHKCKHTEIGIKYSNSNKDKDRQRNGKKKGRKGKKRQTIIYKTLYRKLKID